MWVPAGRGAAQTEGRGAVFGALGVVAAVEDEASSGCGSGVRRHGRERDEKRRKPRHPRVPFAPGSVLPLVSLPGSGLACTQAQEADRSTPRLCCACCAASLVVESTLTPQPLDTDRLGVLDSRTTSRFLLRWLGRAGAFVGCGRPRPFVAQSTLHKQRGHALCRQRLSSQRPRALHSQRCSVNTVDQSTVARSTSLTRQQRLSTPRASRQRRVLRSGPISPGPSTIWYRPSTL